MKTTIIVTDDFYQNPDDVRAYALSQKFEVSGNFPGLRTKPYLPEDLKASIQYIIQHAGGKVLDWLEQYEYTGSFQLCTSRDRTWIHADTFNTWAGVCYLTPDPPVSSGTSFYRYKETKEYFDLSNKSPYDGNDYTKWERTDYIANKYNRIVLYRGNLYHASLDYFGSDNITGRLFQTFFFNTEF